MLPGPFHSAPKKLVNLPPLSRIESNGEFNLITPPLLNVHLKESIQHHLNKEAPWHSKTINGPPDDKQINEYLI